jgi:shikimate dehydrogenase
VQAQRLGLRVISGHTRVAGVIGWPARHSLSPAIHNAAFAALDLDWSFVAFEVADGEARGAIDGMRALGLSGLSVTMPHKAAVADLVDHLGAEAAALGAVNCVVPAHDGLHGENTDGAGFIDALVHDEGFDPARRRCVVIGAGGAGRAVVLALAHAGAADIVVVNRSPEPAAMAVALAGDVGRTGSVDEVAGADLIVNATPLGMGVVVTTAGDLEPLPFDPDRVGTGQLVADLIYQPAVTPLLAAVRSRGATGVNGLGMLIHQAAHAFRRWTGEEPPLEAMSAAALGELVSRQGAIGPNSD